MENPLYEEKSFFEDANKITSLVDYSSSSEDEDEDATPVVKKQRLSDSGVDGDGYFGCDANEENKTEAGFQSPSHFDDTFSDNDDDSERDYFNYNTDHEVLTCGPYSWRREDRWNGREVYCISVVGESPCEKSKCLELLDTIGCADRFLGCSVEMRTFFFANLNEDEAAKMKGLDEVYHVVPRRLIFCNM